LLHSTNLSHRPGPALRKINTARKAENCDVLYRAAWPSPSSTLPVCRARGGHEDADIRGIGDLVSRVLAGIDQPSALIAQSMGGVVAMLAALREPGLVTQLVLSVTSGGMDLAALGGEDWRPATRAAHPGLPDWFTAYHEDLTPRLSTPLIDRHLSAPA
jgi:pimeloyl-ACP methyl ester carboxylesterase